MLPTVEKRKAEWIGRADEWVESARLIQRLLVCEDKVNFSTLRFSLGGEGGVGQVLAKLGDDIVSQLVEWTQGLPYYDTLPLALHTQLLTSKWHELVLLSMAVHICHKDPPCPAKPSSGLINHNKAVQKMAERYLIRIHHFMCTLLDKVVSLEELRADIGEVINKLTFLLSVLQDLGISQEEYVCLKVLVLLSQGRCKQL